MLVTRSSYQTVCMFYGMCIKSRNCVVGVTAWTVFGTLFIVGTRQVIEMPSKSVLELMHKEFANCSDVLTFH